MDVAQSIGIGASIRFYGHRVSPMIMMCATSRSTSCPVLAKLSRGPEFLGALGPL